MKNKLITIGYRGIRQCYLNIAREEAIRRFVQTDGCDPDAFEVEIRKRPDLVEEFEFNQEFGAYDTWQTEKTD